MGDSKKPTIAWINDAQEELGDAIIYLEKLKTVLEEERDYDFDKWEGKD